MRSETAIGVSIPPTGISVKSVMVTLLSGLPIVCGEYTAVLKSGVTSALFSVACSRLLGVQRQVIVRARFQLGDLWNQWQSDAFRVERTIWLAALRHRIPDKDERDRYLRPLRECGWVASKWSVADRSDKHCWTYWLENPKGEGCRASSLPDCVRFTSRVLRDDGEYMEFLTMGEKPGMGRVPVDLPVRDERTKVEQ